MYSAEQIEKLISQAMPGAVVEVKDLTGTRDHFEATVVWKGFDGKSLLEQHRLVMEPLQEGLKEKIHALKIKTRAT